MSRLLEATYQNGSFILAVKLPDSMEGKKVRIVLLEADEIEQKKENFLKLAARHSFTLPSDYKFNRNEIYE
jgi:predicted DNA-binding antitoxin AbrB/MazE fold protein